MQLIRHCHFLFSSFAATTLHHVSEWSNHESRMLSKYSKRIIACLIIFTLLATTYFRNMVWQDSVVLWNDATKKSPYKERTYYNRGLAFHKMGQLDKAMKDYNTAIALNSAYYRAYISRGALYYQAGMITIAIENLNQAIALNPRSGIAYNNRGFMYEKMDMFDQALEDFNKAIEFDPNGVVHSYIDRGNIYLKRGNKELAISDFSKACKLGNKEGCDALRAAQ